MAQETFKVEFGQTGDGRRYVRAACKAASGEVAFSDPLFLGTGDTKALINASMEKARGKIQAYQEARAEEGAESMISHSRK